MLSVLVVNWNTRDLALRCLASLERFPYSGGQEIIVVDNASVDGSAQAIAAGFPGVRLISSAENLGYAAGNNLAMSHASGEWLLTLNPDTEVFEDTLNRAVSELERSPEFGALGARLVGPDGATQRSVRGFPTALGILGDVTGLARLFPKSRLGGYRLLTFDYESRQAAPQPMGTFLLFRRKALEEVGGHARPFDEQFPIFFNEVDLLFRLARAGWPCLYAPDVRVLHVGGASTKQARKAMIWESHRSLLRFMQKHCRTPWNAPFFPILGAILFLTAWIRARGYSRGFGA